MRLGRSSSRRPQYRDVAAMTLALSSTPGCSSGSSTPRLRRTTSSASTSTFPFALTSVPTATSTLTRDSRPAFPRMSKPYRETRRTGETSSTGDPPAPSSSAAAPPPSSRQSRSRPSSPAVSPSSIWLRVPKSRSKPTPTISTRNTARLYSSRERIASASARKRWIGAVYGCSAAGTKRTTLRPRSPPRAEQDSRT